MPTSRDISLTLLSLCACAVVSLPGCGSGSGGGDPTPPAATPSTPSAAGEWTGSYTVGASARAMGGGSSGLAMMTPGVLSSLLTSVPAVGGYTVTFTIRFSQTGSAITGSYEDDQGRVGTVTGTLVNGALSTTTTFVSGASGTLALNGTVTLSGTTSTIGAATVTENFSVSGTAYNHSNVTADLTGTGTNGTPGTVATVEDRFQGTWQSVDTGINDEAHDGDGSILAITKDGSGTWHVGNALGQDFGVTATQSGTVLTFIGDDGVNNGVQSWFKEVWSISGTVVVSEASYLTGPTTRPLASANGWISRGSHAWVRKALTDVPLLVANAAATNFNDYDAGAITAASDDVTSINLQLLTADTITVEARFAGALDTARAYQVSLRAEEGSGNNDGVIKAWISYNTGTSQWESRVTGGTAQALIPAITPFVQATGAHPFISVTIPMADFQANLGNGSLRPTLAYARASSYSDNGSTDPNVSKWDVIDQTAAKYVRIPAAPPLPAFTGAWERPDSGILDSAHDGGNYVISITESGGTFDVRDFTGGSFGFPITRSGNDLRWIIADGGNPVAKKTVFSLNGDVITESVYNYTTPTVPDVDNPTAWVLESSQTWSRRATAVPTLSATPLVVNDTDATTPAPSHDVTVSRAYAIGDSLFLNWDFAGALDTTADYDVELEAAGPSVDHNDTLKVEIRYVSGSWVATATSQYNGTPVTISTGVVTTVGTQSIAVTIAKSALAATQTANVVPTGASSVCRVHSSGSPSVDYERSVKPFFFIP